MFIVQSSNIHSQGSRDLASDLNNVMLTPPFGNSKQFFFLHCTTHRRINMTRRTFSKLNLVFKSGDYNYQTRQIGPTYDRDDDEHRDDERITHKSLTAQRQLPWQFPPFNERIPLIFPHPIKNLYIPPLTPISTDQNKTRKRVTRDRAETQNSIVHLAYLHQTKTNT